jgi:gas vesicle protein
MSNEIANAIFWGLIGGFIWILLELKIAPTVPNWTLPIIAVMISSILSGIKYVSSLKDQTMESRILNAILQLKIDLKSDMHELRTELKADIQDVRTELKADIQDVRTELKADIQDVRTELKADIQDVRTELKADIQGVKKDLSSELGNKIDKSGNILSQLAQRVSRLEGKAESRN